MLIVIDVFQFYLNQNFVYKERGENRLTGAAHFAMGTPESEFQTQTLGRLN